MKYRKELRWLVFMLGPFIAILGLHVITPLQITSSCFDIFTEVFGFTQSGLHFRNSARSMHLQNSKVIRSFYTQLATQLIFFKNISLAKINSRSYHNNTLVNPFMIKQNSTHQQHVVSQSNYSIWFDINNQYHNIQDLPPELLQNTRHYLSIEPFIKSYFKFNKKTFIQSVSMFYNNVNDSIYFQYPLERYVHFDDAQLNSVKTKFTTILNISHNIAFFQFDANDLTDMSICIKSEASSYQFAICININIKIFAEYLWRKLSLLKSQVFNTKGYLNIEGIEKSNQVFNIVFQYDQHGFRNVQIVNGTYQIGNQSLDGLFSKVQELQFFTLFQSQTDIYISKIKHIQLPKNLHAPHYVTNVVRVATVSKYQSASGTLNTIVIVTIILVIIQIIILGFVLKNLLDSVEKGLFELGNMTHHIMRGDINICIPSYEGTKDIGQVYDVAKKLNKLHRYSTQSYFSGHFSEKILKYVQALQFIKSLNYDPGNLYQNLGEAYTYIEQWDLSLKYLHKSVDNIMEHISNKFQPFQQIYKRKLGKQSLPHRYREIELILIRRLFKLVYCYIRYLQLGPTHLKKLQVDNSNDEQIKKKLQQLNNQFAESVAMIKKVFYPNFQKFSEVLVTLSFQCKNKFGNKKIEEGKAIFKNTEQIYAIYKQNHPSVMKMLKQKGSKNKYLYSSNKLTFQSRFHPDLLVSLMTSTRVKIISVFEKQPKKYNKIFQLYTQAFKTGQITMNTAYMLGLQVRRAIIQLKIDPQPYETTQIFKQLVPFRTFYDGKVTKENETQLLKKVGTQCIGLEREYVFVIDCERDFINGEALQEFYQQRSTYLLNKLIKGHDRISIIKVNTKEGIKVECNLLMKKDNQPLITNSLKQAIMQRNKENKLKINLFEVISRTIWRIKNLQKQKILIFFFRSLKQYKYIASKTKKSTSNYEKRRNQGSFDDQINKNQYGSCIFSEFGQAIVQTLRTPGLRNTKLILYCGKDSNHDFVQFFGLRDINRRIWAENNGLNKDNNTVFIIEDKHRSDIDRILMPKVTDVPDNNIFIL